MKSCDGGVRLLDTHAGIGTYRLYQQTSNEYKNGIQRILEACTDDDTPAAVQRYLDFVRSFNNGDELRVLPGSPALATSLLRTGTGRDEHLLWELNPSECQQLQTFLSTQSFPSVVFCQDGFANVSSSLASGTRQNFVLVDPPYKSDDEYVKTLNTVKQGLASDPDATIMAWIPQLSYKQEVQTLDYEILKAASKSWRVRASLTVQTSGLLGSTVVIINPPLGMYDTLQSTLPWLAKTLAQDCCDYSVTQSNMCK